MSKVYSIVNARVHGHAMYALEQVVESYKTMIADFKAKDPDDPAIAFIQADLEDVSQILLGLQYAMVNEDDALKDIFGKDYLLLSDETKDKFIIGYAPSDEIN